MCLYFDQFWKCDCHASRYYERCEDYEGEDCVESEGSSSVLGENCNRCPEDEDNDNDA